jgi:hypothetical protein
MACAAPLLLVLVERLQAKPGAERLSVVVGDLTDVAVGRTFRELEHRWADWARSPFVSASPGPISVYRKPGRSRRERYAHIV